MARVTTTPEQAAADLIAKIGEASKSFADAEKTRAEADKQRADTAKVRADSEADQRLAQNKVELAAEDLEGKRIANTLAQGQADAAHTDKLIEQLKGAVPDLASLGKSTVTFRDGKALRQGESISVALSKVAEAIGSKVVEAVGTQPSKEVFVVTDPGLVATLAASSLLMYEASTLKQKVTDAKDSAQEALEAGPDGSRRAIAVEAGIVAAAVAGKAATQLASLFELDVDVSSGATDIPAITVQAAVIENLLGSTTEVTVRHERARIPIAGGSALLGTIQDLIALDIDATAVDALLDAAIKELGDPASAVAKAEQVANDEKKSANQRADAERAAKKAQEGVVRLAQLQNLRTSLRAILEKSRAFAERVTKAPAVGEPSALLQALSVEPLSTGDCCVLVVSGGKAETYQAVVKRRLRAPQLQTSTSVEVDFVLVLHENVLASGHKTASVAFAGTIAGRGAEWKTMKALSAS